MYTAPDFVKVKTNVKDVFYPYGCPHDHFGNWSYTDPCEGTDSYRFVGDTFPGLGWGDGCYSTKDA